MTAAFDRLTRLAIPSGELFFVKAVVRMEQIVGLTLVPVVFFNCVRLRCFRCLHRHVCAPSGVREYNDGPKLSITPCEVLPFNYSQS
jgi:hypothetical protein